MQAALRMVRERSTLAALGFQLSDHRFDVVEAAYFLRHVDRGSQATPTCERSRPVSSMPWLLRPRAKHIGSSHSLATTNRSVHHFSCPGCKTTVMDPPGGTVQRSTTQNN